MWPFIHRILRILSKPFRKHQRHRIKPTASTEGIQLLPVRIKLLQELLDFYTYYSVNLPDDYLLMAFTEIAMASNIIISAELYPKKRIHSFSSRYLSPINYFAVQNYEINNSSDAARFLTKHIVFVIYISHRVGNPRIEEIARALVKNIPENIKEQPEFKQSYWQTPQPPLLVPQFARSTSTIPTVISVDFPQTPTTPTARLQPF